MTNAKSKAIESISDIRKFILGGNAICTLLEGSTHHTFKIKSAKKNQSANWSTGNQDKTRYFVSVLTGSDNHADYQYLGMLALHPIEGLYHFARTKASKFDSDSPSYRLFRKLWIGVEQACKVPSSIQFFHEGQCAICGRTLTVPESIERGIGPECAGKEGV